MKFDFYRTVAVVGTVSLTSFYAYASTEGQGVDGQDQALNKISETPTASVLEKSEVNEEATDLSQQQTTVLNDRDVSSVKFTMNSAVLAPSERESLRVKLSTVKNDPQVKKIVVAAWSDRAMPIGNQKLKEQERELANQRAEAVEEIFDELDIDNVETYSMAEQAGWIAHAFNTSEAAIKGSAERTSHSVESRDKISQTLNEKGGPSTAVIVLVRDETGSSRLSH